jgi:hypothetical protein
MDAADWKRKSYTYRGAEIRILAAASIGNLSHGGRLLDLTCCCPSLACSVRVQVVLIIKDA